jgi:hypothetical protein
MTRASFELLILSRIASTLVCEPNSAPCTQPAATKWTINIQTRRRE